MPEKGDDVINYLCRRYHHINKCEVAGIQKIKSCSDQSSQSGALLFGRYVRQCDDCQQDRAPTGLFVRP